MIVFYPFMLTMVNIYTYRWNAIVKDVDASKLQAGIEMTVK